MLRRLFQEPLIFINSLSNQLQAIYPGLKGEMKYVNVKRWSEMVPALAHHPVPGLGLLGAALHLLDGRHHRRRLRVGRHRCGEKDAQIRREEGGIAHAI